QSYLQAWSVGADTAGVYSRTMNAALADDLFDDDYLASRRPDPDAWLEPPFSTLKDTVALVDDLGTDGRPIERLRQQLAFLTRHPRAPYALRPRGIAALDRAQQAAGDDHRAEDGPPRIPTDAWLQQTMGLTSSAAYAQLRTARSLSGLRRTAQALRQGQIGS